MKYIFFIITGLISAYANAQTNQHALTAAGGHQGKIGNYFFEFSVGQPFTQTGQGTGFWNTPGILQPVGSEAALPVTLVSFAVEKSENTVHLSWITTQEENSDKFVVQRSLDGKSWIEIGNVDAAGDTKHTVTHYSFIDDSPAHGDNLYRLKMVDLDGTFAYSNIRSIRFENSIQITVFPNPATDKVRVIADRIDDVHSITLVNMSGQKVYRSTEKPVNEIALSHLPEGLYVLNLMCKSGEVITRKLLIKR